MHGARGFPSNSNVCSSPGSCDEQVVRLSDGGGRVGGRRLSRAAWPTGLVSSRPPHRTVHAVVEIEIRRAHRVEIVLQLATFPEAPPRSRTVGFPESGSAVLHTISQGGPSPRRETAVPAHPSPRRGGVCIAPSPRRRPGRTQLCVWSVPACRGHRVPRAPLPGTGVTRAEDERRPFLLARHTL